jgi:hypothetical protein
VIVLDFRSASGTNEPGARMVRQATPTGDELRVVWTAENKDAISCWRRKSLSRPAAQRSGNSYTAESSANLTFPDVQRRQTAIRVDQLPAGHEGYIAADRWIDETFAQIAISECTISERAVLISDSTVTFLDRLFFTPLTNQLTPVRSRWLPSVWAGLHPRQGDILQIRQITKFTLLFI